MSHIPVEEARQIALTYQCRQVILVAWDGHSTHVVTFGESIDDSDQAAQGGDRIKDALGWPKHLRAESPRVTEMRARLSELETENQRLKRVIAEAVTGLRHAILGVAYASETAECAERVYEKLLAALECCPLPVERSKDCV